VTHGKAAYVQKQQDNPVGSSRLAICQTPIASTQRMLASTSIVGQQDALCEPAKRRHEEGMAGHKNNKECCLRAS